MKFYRYVRWIVVPAFLALFLLGCDETAIFYTLENVYPIEEDKGLENNIAVYEMVNTGTRYFAAADELYTRTDSGEDWKTVALPPDAPDGSYSNTIEIFGGDLYAGFVALDGTGLGLYRTVPDTINWTTNEITAAEVRDVQIGMVKEVGGTLYVVTAVWNDSLSLYDYKLYSTGNGDDYTQIQFDSSLSPITTPIIDIEQYGGTPEYWVIAGKNLYADTDGTLDDLTLQSGAGIPQTSRIFGGLLVSTDLYLSAKDGKLWRYDSALPTPWSSSSTIEVDDTVVRFSKFVDVSSVTSVTFPYYDDILVGTEGTGYYWLIDKEITDAGTYKVKDQRRPTPTIDLYKGAINSFYLDTTVVPEVLFACTYGAGLWRMEYNDEDEEWKWYQE